MHRIKVCCISSLDEAKAAIEFGASAIGLVSEMPSGPGVINEELIRDISRNTPPPIGTFLLTSRTNPKDIIQQHNNTLTNTLQIVDYIQEESYMKIKRELPFVKIVQVVHVQGEQSIDKALSISEYVDAILLDSGNPNLAVKELGGTGRPHDWSISRKIVEKVPVPVFLAGGLNAGNVKQAIEAVQPYGLDLCSGVRTDGKLDKFKLEEFFEAATT